MDEVAFLNLLEDRTLFAPTSGHRAIEIHIRPGSQSPYISETSLAERQISSWCHEGAFDGEGSLFRLLFCNPRVLDQNIWPLPISSSTLNGMINTLEIPTLFPRAICRHIPIATGFESLESSDRRGVLLRTNLSWTWQYALALVHDSVKRITTGILFGLRSNEVDEVLQSIRRSAALMVCPAMLPCILMDKALDALVKDAEDRRRSLIQVCFDTGLHGFHRASFKQDQWDDRDDLDLDVVMQKLTTLSDACAGMSAVCKMQLNFIDVVSAFRAQCSSTTPGITTDKAGRYAREQLNFFGHFLHGIESKILYTKNSVQGQVQTIYTLISQRESRSQMVLTKASRRLAELSRKESTDMRVISAVTLLFLPATFTSTFFSASFFNFQPAQSERVSRWIWVYFVVTALVTTIVLSSWWYSARRQHQKAQETFRRESHFHHEKATQDRSSTLVEPQPIARVEALRPYLSGSIAEGMFAKKLSIPFDSSNRVETVNVSPTATFARCEN